MGFLHEMCVCVAGGGCGVFSVKVLIKNKFGKQRVKNSKECKKCFTYLLQMTSLMIFYIYIIVIKSVNKIKIHITNANGRCPRTWFICALCSLPVKYNLLQSSGM